MWIDVLIAFAVVAAVGLIAAVLLALASHFLHVPEDPKIGQVRNCLPGANCGACGYTGCDDYAAAVASGAAAPNRCIPGGEDTANQIGEIMGVEAGEIITLVAHVQCNGTCDAAKTKANYDGQLSCSAAAALYGGPGECLQGCLGCGDCAAACPSNAICIGDGVARVDPRKCTGCGICVATCPRKIIHLINSESTVAVKCSNSEKGPVARKMCTHACIGCKKCERDCPQKAISIVNNIAVINYEHCNDCGQCVLSCPMHCIHDLLPKVRGHV